MDPTLNQLSYTPTPFYTLLTLGSVWIEELPLSLHVDVQNVNGCIVQPFAV